MPEKGFAIEAADSPEQRYLQEIVRITGLLEAYVPAAEAARVAYGLQESAMRMDAALGEILADQRVKNHYDVAHYDGIYLRDWGRGVMGSHVISRGLTRLGMVTPEFLAKGRAFWSISGGEEKFDPEKLLDWFRGSAQTNEKYLWSLRDTGSLDLPQASAKTPEYTDASPMEKLTTEIKKASRRQPRGMH